MSWKAIGILVLAWVLVAPGAAIAGGVEVTSWEGITLGGQEMSVVAQAMGNSDIVLVHVGLSEPNNVAAWGLSVSHQPQVELVDHSTSFGVWGSLSTEIPLVEPGVVPGLWAGLTARPFIDIDVLYDVEHDRIAVWPGAGVRVAPTKTLSFIARAVYPIGDDNLPSAIDLNEVTGLFGLEVRF